MLLRDVLLLPSPAAPATTAAPPQPTAPTSLRLHEGRIAEVGPDLRPTPGEEVHDADGALAIPGLWDHHVHVGQTAQGYARLDTAGVPSVDAMLRLLTTALDARGPDTAGPDDRPASGGAAPGRPSPARTDARTPALVGFGHRLVDMAGEPTVAALDSVSGPADPATGRTVPVVLIGGDAHHAWMNSAALAALGLPPRRGIVAEDEWFDAVTHLDDLPGVSDDLERGVEQLQTEALARGVVGVTDMEWAENWRLWQRRGARLRVRTATYASGLDGVPGPTGTPLTADGLVRMGPLKVIADGSLGSRSAYCRHPYAFSGEVDAHPLGGGFGVLSEMAEELPALLRRAAGAGLEAAVHAIGDAAAAVVLDAFAATGRRGRIEHAQLLADADVARMAHLGMTASVQPAHLLDDRDPTEEVWPDVAAESYRLRDLVDAGVPLLLGSDAPVAPVDPWLAMAAAVHRSADERPAWFPDQQLQPREALDASTDGVTALRAGGPADLVLLDPADSTLFAPVLTGPDGLLVEPAAREAAARLRATRPLATLVAGRLAHSR